MQPSMNEVDATLATNNDLKTKNFKITMEYDGTPFSGWQIQKAQTTIQGELEKALSLILNQQVNIMGSGRTDAGVHAMGQVASFTVNTRRSPHEIQKGLNSLIKKSPIVIHRCEEMDGDFHARYSAISKEYHYHILNRRLPCAIGKNYVWHISKPLDIEIMNHCCYMIVGEHDFKSFEAAGSPRAHTVRSIYHASVDASNGYRIEKEEDGRIVFKIKGNGFLRFMVRNIVGTLVMAGHHQITPEGFKTILKAKNRAIAGATAPPHGLCLMQVNY